MLWCSGVPNEVASEVDIQRIKCKGISFVKELGGGRYVYNLAFTALERDLVKGVSSSSNLAVHPTAVQITLNEEAKLD